MPVPELGAAWDTLRLAGRVVQCKNPDVHVTLPSGVDPQKPKGGKKSKNKDQGDPPAKVKIKLQLADDAQRNAFLALVPFLRPHSKTGARNPIEIIHPNTAFWGIRYVTIGDIDSPMPSAVTGWTVEIEAFEWSTKPIAVKQPNDKKPKGASDGWAPFVDDKVRQEAPAHTDAPMTNLF